jgi:hypothetical protein
MPDLNWALTVNIGGGPQFSSSQAMTVQAFDNIVVTVAGADQGSPTTVAVDVQPGDTEQIKFLLISSDRYGNDLKYSVDGGAGDIVLDAAQLLVGAGSVGLLGAAPKTLEFSNGLGEGNDVVITIIVGRDAVA